MKPLPVRASSGVDREEQQGRWGWREQCGRLEGLLRLWKREGQSLSLWGACATPAAGLLPSLCPPLGQERSNKLFGWEERMEEVDRDGRGPWGG